MKPITLEELSKEKIDSIKPYNTRCPMRDCYKKGNYQRCYLDTCCLCPIYDIKYNRLSQEQKKLL